jgi:hypothetical protein
VSYDHFYTASASEMASAIANNGYAREPNAARIFLTQAPGNVALFRLWSATQSDHFYTANSTEADQAAASQGYVFEGVAGYVYADGSCAGTVPLYRAFHGGTVWDHFYTTSLTDLNAAITQSGYVSEGIAAYVLSA